MIFIFILMLYRLSSTQYIRVRVGEHSFYVDEGSENNAVIQNLIIHPQYIHSQNKNDIALIKLTKPVNMNDKHVNTACMPVSSDMSTFYQTSECFATGWGQTQGKFVYIYSMLLPFSIIIYYRFFTVYLKIRAHILCYCKILL